MNRRNAGKRWRSKLPRIAGGRPKFCLEAERHNDRAYDRLEDLSIQCLAVMDMAIWFNPLTTKDLVIRCASEKLRPGSFEPGLVPLNRVKFSGAILPVGALLKEAAREVAI